MVNPTTNVVHLNPLKEHLMKKIFFTFAIAFILSGCVASKTYHTQIQKVGDKVTMQLGYDDGSSDGPSSPWSERAGSEVGVIFSSPVYPATLEKASFYVSRASAPTTPFKVNIYQVNADKVPEHKLISENIIVSAESGSKWVDVDLTAYNLVVLNDFMIAMEWLTPFHPPKGLDAQVIGTDLSNGDSRSYWRFAWQDNWKPVSEIGKSGDRNNMIRATVTYKSK